MPGTESTEQVVDGYWRTVLIASWTAFKQSAIGDIKMSILTLKNLGERERKVLILHGQLLSTTSSKLTLIRNLSKEVLKDVLNCLDYHK